MHKGEIWTAASMFPFLKFFQKPGIQKFWSTKHWFDKIFLHHQSTPISCCSFYVPYIVSVEQRVYSDSVKGFCQIEH